MQQKSFFLMLLPPLLLLPLISGARKEAAVGGWTPIEDIMDPRVKEIGEFAVEEHNKQAKTNMKFLKVVKGEQQVVAGKNYRLMLDAGEGPEINLYEAEVFEQSWQNVRKLTSFKAVEGITMT